MNARPYAEGLLCARSVIGHFQEQEVTALCITLHLVCPQEKLSHGRWLRGVTHEATVAALTWPEPRPGSVGAPWPGVSSELEGPSEGVASTLLVHNVPIQAHAFDPQNGSLCDRLGRLLFWGDSVFCFMDKFPGEFF